MLAIECNEYEIARYMVDHCNGDLNKTYVDPPDRLELSTNGL